jgi:putative chitinase
MMRSQLLAAVPCGPRLADTFVGPISSACHEFDINTPARVAAFVAQCAHESACFALLREGWGPTPTQLGYEGRADLGNTEPGDGAKFKGRGLIQITGRANYAACSLALFNDLRLLERPELLEDPTQAARSAAWFWKQHGLNELADVGNFKRVTKLINGGYTHYDRRLKLYQRALPAFGGPINFGTEGLA